MAAKIRIWHRDHGGDLAPLDTTYARWFAGSSPLPTDEPQEAAVGIHPISTRAEFIGVAMVPVELDGGVALNGTPLQSGIFGLRHADRLDVNGHSIWIAASSVVETTAYDPAVHGGDVFCFLTKARLAPGQAIVVCPGTPGQRCNAIYTQEAWEMAMQSSTRLRCANCNFRPDQPEWHPPDHQSRRRVDDILATIANGRA